MGGLGIWYWRHWGQLGPHRAQYAIFVVVMLMFSFVNGLAMANSGVDSWGHLGGLIFGVFISAILFQTTNNLD
jgi:membrane associated rhomboid family serine protease